METIKSKKWTVDMSNKTNITVDDAKFIFEQAEKCLKNSTDIGISIVTRTNTLITVSLGIILGLTSYAISQFEKQDNLSFLAIASMFGVLYLFAIILYTVRNIQPSPYYVSGSQPKALFADAFFVETIKPKDRIISFYISEIHNYQHRIDVNVEINRKRWHRYKTTVWALILMPIIVLTVSYITSLIL